MSIRKNLIAVSIAATALLALTVTADAKCTKLASSVNDYGKVGPAKDAQALLDKQIAENMAKRGVKTYNTGKKEVTCELFLDFGVFDEYTCKAAATVCWNEGGGTAPAVEASAKTAPITTGSTKKEPAVKDEAAPKTPAAKAVAKKKDPA